MALKNYMAQLEIYDAAAASSSSRRVCEPSPKQERKGEGVGEEVERNASRVAL